MSNYQIFISYRRTGGEDLAGRLSDKLKALGYRVFYDIESMHAGTFNTQILDAISQCEDVLLILPPNSLDRCKDPQDWVRQEIEHAMAQEKNIIPIMMRDFQFPAYLPPSIDAVRYFEGVQMITAYFDACVQRIQSLLHSKVGPTPVEQNENLTKGVRFLNAKQYKQALICLQQAAVEDLSNPEVYFYTAVALLGGKRPFLHPKKVIDQVLEQLQTALDMEEQPLYRYFLAYVKYDYHHLKVLRTVPDFMGELARAQGLDRAKGDALFALLNVDKPDLF